MGRQPKPKCPECARGEVFYEGCAHVNCPQRKPWGRESESEGLVLSGSPVRLTNGKDGVVEVGVEGCFRTPKKGPGYD